MRKLSESMWADAHKKNVGIETRKEDGTRVKTCLGIDILLQNPHSEYDTLIYDILGTSKDIFDFSIYTGYDSKFTNDELINIKNFKAPYDYQIFDGRTRNTDLYVSFGSYNDIKEWFLDDEFINEYSEKDYVSICRCIATKLKEVGEYLEFVPSSNHVRTISDTTTNIKDYKQEFQLRLIDESSVYGWTCDNEDFDDFLTVFEDDIMNEFPELRSEDFIIWDYNNYGGCYIAIPLTINNINNIQKYAEYTKSWFES